MAAPASAARIESIDRSVRAEADYYLDSSYYVLSDSDYDSDATLQRGRWDRSVEARAYSFGRLSDAYGRVDLRSYADESRIEFDSTIVAESDFFYDSGGDPTDERTYYYEEESAQGAAEASLSMVFTVTSRADYYLELSGTNETGFGGRRNGGSARLVVDPLYFPFPQLLFDLTLPEPGEVVSQSGVLRPGEYRLDLMHFSQAGGAVGMNLLLVIPEPGTAILLGAGLGCLARRTPTRRRRG